MLSHGAAPRYRLEEQVGEGGMGTVYAATMQSPAGERRVAMKRLGASVADTALVAARDRLLAEGRLVFQLTHANICQVIDLAEDEGDSTYIVMEYVDGTDLARLVRRRGQLGIAHALYVGREVARALDYAHRKVDADGRALGIVHGDVTARNVLISIEGEVKLADFGISRALGTAAPGNSVIAGTPGFTAPEVETGVFDERADVYGLGVCVYVALTGIWPEQPVFALDQLASARPEVSRTLAEIVARATARQPGARYASAGDLEEALTVELSRTAPGFRPSHLADEVRAARLDRDRRSRGNAPATELRSLTVPMQQIPGLAEAPARAGTRTIARSEQRPTQPGEPHRRWRTAALFVGAAATAGVFMWAVRPSQDEPAPRVTNAEPRRAGSDGVPSDAQTVVRANAGASLDAAPTAPPSRPPVKREPMRPANTRKSGVPQAPAGASSNPARLTISAEPWGLLYIDNAKVADETPVFDLSVTAGRRVVKVFFPSLGRFSPAQTVELPPGGKRTLVFRP